MDYQLQFMRNFTNSLPFLNKFYAQDRLPLAAVCDHDPQSSPSYCAICLNDICGGDSYRRLPDCRHCFHAHCIDPWLESHSTCPLCRTQLPQMISLKNDNQFDVVSNIILLLRNFVQKMCDPLNDELSSMLCGASLG